MLRKLHALYICYMFKICDNIFAIYTDRLSCTTNLAHVAAAAHQNIDFFLSVQIAVGPKINARELYLCAPYCGYSPNLICTFFCRITTGVHFQLSKDVSKNRRDWNLRPR